MDAKQTKLKLQQLAVQNNALAGMLLSIIKKCDPQMQELLFKQMSDSFKIIDRFEEKLSSPEFKKELERRIRNGR